ncbi:nitrile hydratase subunit alpha [Kibdelosporangium phytohabitans]|uniref:Nitrile hydratase subunit alpha n=1 Tax=Kibdelosporangium phytohabitans TaxID=860235 RepID=A0A0N9I8A4_9PSEU|nr:nitrile hydratase subunit alpha [Kibdelosporangium phytohabitans]ALG12544.1 nitrile hydratase subunit alpha [Kibdelosporangium phytohabitans]MBE1464157.1 nitrile hydratase [Kibdelosporangium phytohabitans]
MSGDHSDAPIAARVRRMEHLLEQRGLVEPGVLDETLAAFLNRATPMNGARIVARAWTDPVFRERLLVDAQAAIAGLELSMGGGLRVQDLQVVANSEDEHNVVVCTLCSCYPLALLGPSPTWYKSEAYRSRVVREPREVLREFGVDLRPEVGIEVWDANSEIRYMVVPNRPPGTENLTEEQLAALVTRNGLIGTALV